MKTISAFLIVVCIVGCRGEKKAKLDYVQTTDTLHFDQPFPLSLIQYKQMGNANLLYCWNGPASELLVYEIDHKRSVANIKITDSAVNNIDLGNLRSFYVHNYDSIIVQRMYSLSILDSSGTVRFRKIINGGPDQDDWPPVVYNNYGNVFPVYYDAPHNQILVRQYSGTIENWKKDFFSVKVEAALTPGDSLLKELPVAYPDIYRKAFFGEADLAFREAGDTFNVYTFMASPDLYVYNRYTHEGKKIAAKSALESGEFLPLDTSYKEEMNHKVDHLIENPLHMKVIFDPYKGLYYRFILNGIKLKNEDGTYNEFGDKDLLISVFDRQFRLLGEVNTGKGHLWFFSFATPKGLYILKETPTITSHQNIVDGQSFVFDVLDFGNHQ